MDGDITDFVYVQCTGPHVGAIYSLYEFELGKNSRQRRVSCRKDLRLIDVERPFDSSTGFSLDSLARRGVYFRPEVIYHHRTADAAGNSRSLLLLSVETPIGTSTKTNRSHSTRNSYSQHSVFIYTPPITCTSPRSQTTRRTSLQDGSCEFRTGSLDPGGTALIEFRTACFFLIVLYRCILSVITILPSKSHFHPQPS